MDLDEDQMEELQAIMKKLPLEARPKAEFHFDMGDKTTAMRLRSSLLMAGIVRQLFNALKNSRPNLPSPIAANIAACLRLFCENPKDRGLVVHQGGMTAMLMCADVLENKGPDLREIRQALAQLCISMNAELYSYEVIHALIPHLLEMLRDSYELFQFEAALGLTNLLSLNEDVQE
ncbi:tetratricopeptide repeat-containing protein, partial [Cardiosporidium cionae]